MNALSRAFWAARCRLALLRGVFLPRLPQDRLALGTVKNCTVSCMTLPSGAFVPAAPAGKCWRADGTGVARLVPYPSWRNPDDLPRTPRRGGCRPRRPGAA